MSEQAPRIVPEVVNDNPDSLPPRDEAIDAVRNEINSLETELQEAEAKVATPGFKATANDIIANRAELKQLREENGPRLEGLQAMWTEFGGADIDKAQADVDALNFNSDANDHVASKTGLRDTKDAFYAKLEEAMKDKQADATRVHDVEDAYVLADAEEKSRSGADDLNDEPDDDVDTDHSKKTDKDPSHMPVDVDSSTGKEDDLWAGWSADEKDEYSRWDHDDPRSTDEDEHRSDDPDWFYEDRSRSADDDREDDDEILVVSERKTKRERFKDLYSTARARMNALFGNTLYGNNIVDRYRGSKKSTKFALGAVALTGLLVAAWAIKEGVHDHATSAAGDAAGNTPPVDNSNIPPVDNNGIDLPRKSGIDSAPATPDVAYSADALRTDTGEGWFQTMSEIGIKDSDTRQAILSDNSVMGKLRDMGLAYRAPELGGWGINMPATGQMPKAALDLLREAAVTAHDVKQNAPR